MNPFVIDDTQDRALKLFNYLKKLCPEITVENNLSSTIPDVVDMSKKLETADVLFIHNNNHRAKELIDALENAEIFVVAYSGGGMSVSYSQTNIVSYKEVFDIYSYSDLFVKIKLLNELMKQQKYNHTECKHIFGYSQ